MTRQPHKWNSPRRRPAARAGRVLQRLLRRSTPAYFPIAYKLALIITLLITTGMVILGSVIVKNQTRLLRAQINDFGQAVVTQLAESSKELVMSDDELSLMTVVNNLGSSRNILGAVVYAEDGKVLAVSGILPGDDISGLYANADRIDDRSYSVAWQASDSDGKVIKAISFIEPVRFQNVIAGHALVTFSKGALDQSLHETVIAIVMATTLMILLGIVVSFYLGDLLAKQGGVRLGVAPGLKLLAFSITADARRGGLQGHLLIGGNRVPRRFQPLQGNLQVGRPGRFPAVETASVVEQRRVSAAADLADDLLHDLVHPRIGNRLPGQQRFQAFAEVCIGGV